MAKSGSFKPGSKKHKPGFKKRENKCIVMFDDKDRQEFLTGFHKRKVERRKAAVEEIKNKIKEEQKRVREERHKEYLKMLKERKEALEEADELEEAITGTTESVQYDHPNHTVTVTTISDLDLSGAHLLETATKKASEDGEEEEDNEEEQETKPLPKQAGNPLLSKKIKSLTAALNMRTKQQQQQKKNRKRKQEAGGHGRSTKRKPADADNKLRIGRTTKRERRRRTGRRGGELN
ncbi:nucleolar protein 12 [Chanos chanos]|uniref:Nucleolar protein 12 n=1 Tax=Chanos chanos TaxID=29144 RepID=A0A6J2WZW5_CHACN|nr:nucleolar protein 12 [Chanos chanos]